MADNYSIIKPTTIYTLSDPETGEVRYVGKTITSLDVRLRKHLKDKGRNHRTYWIRSILAKGLNPAINAIEDGIGENWAERERYWILYYKEKGAHLVNLTDGGDGMYGYIHLPESRAKIAAANKGKPKSIEHREKLRISSQGRKHSTETRAKISVIVKGRKLSPEQCKKISDSHKGIKFSDETRAKIGESNRGKRRSIEARAKISAALKGKPSPNKGRVFSAETRAKMSAAHKRRRYGTSQDQLKLDL